MHIRSWLGALCSLSLLGAPDLASAFGPPGHGHGMRPEQRLEETLEELGLEPEQLEAVRALLDESRRVREAHREEVRAAFEAMHALLDQDLPDEEAVMRQADLLGELHTEGHKAMLHTLLAVRAQLTPDQRTALRERMREAMEQRRAKHRRHREGPDAR